MKTNRTILITALLFNSLLIFSCTKSELQKPIESLESCETEFKGETISCDYQREAIFSFTAGNAMDYVKLQGELKYFTGIGAVITVDGGNMTVVQSTPAGSTNRVITVEGSVDACETVKIKINWFSTHSTGAITGFWSARNASGDEIVPSIEGLECDNRKGL